MNQSGSSDNRNKNYTKFRGIIHFTMGILYLLMGGATVYLVKIGYFNIEMAMGYVIGGLMFAYGIFRIFRGIQRLRGKAEGW